MSQLSLDKFGENLPVSGIVGFSQVAIGLGAGFLVADSIGQNARRNAGIALIGLGAAALVPIVGGSASPLSSPPDSPRATRTRLEGIRGEFDDSDQE
ncbi:MAG: hypothetical protein ACKOLA_08260 [Spartobacteria bacterium]